MYQLRHVSGAVVKKTKIENQLLRKTDKKNKQKSKIKEFFFPSICYRLITIKIFYNYT
jgi:hypothetical protein